MSLVIVSVLGIALLFGIVALSTIDVALSLSFFISAVSFLVVFRHLSKGAKDLLFSCYLVFHLVFFLAIPLIQAFAAEQTSQFVNTLPWSSFGAQFSNYMTTGFLLTAYLAYVTAPVAAKPSVTVTDSPYFVAKVWLLVFLCFLLALIFANSIYQDSFSRIAGFSVAYEDQSIGRLIRSKFIYSIPFAVVICSLYYSSFTRHKVPILAMLVLIPLAMFFKNPILENRNAVGPFYLICAYYLMPGLFATNTRVIGLLASVLLIAFPSFSFLTHGHLRNSVLEGTFVWSDLTNQFNSVHFDAWANIYGALVLVQNIGHTWGGNILSASLFFVPKSIWQSKMDHSGLILGDHLMTNYQMWFNNISFPLIAELFLAFNVFGVIIGALLFGGIAKFIRDLNQAPLWMFVAFSIFYIARGSLMPSFAYTVAALLAIALMDKIFRLGKFAK